MHRAKDWRPGLNHQRLLRLMSEAIERCHLRLDRMTVLTEAASGSYIVTPVMAALAGAQKVYAVTRTTRYGTVEEIVTETRALAAAAGVEERIQFRTEKTCEMLSNSDIVTNSGHVRPLDQESVHWIRPDAVVPLMYEKWEYRPDDIDVAACRERGVLVGGTNERHPAIDVFSFLAPMATKMLFDAGVSVYGSNILLLCDNTFAEYIDRGLRAVGARVSVASSPDDENLSGGPYDAVLVALTPRPNPVLSVDQMRAISDASPGIVVAQYWGDLDRRAAHDAGLAIWPEAPPMNGHMGILPAAVGPEPTVRLQTGGLKAGEVLFTRSFLSDREAAQFVELM